MIPLVVGAGVLAYAAYKRNRTVSAEIANQQLVEAKKASEVAKKEENDAKDAGHANAVFSVVLGGATTAAVALTSGWGTVFAGAAASAVGTSWASLDVKSKARIWRGETS